MDADYLRKLIEQLLPREDEARKNGRLEEADNFKAEIDALYRQLDQLGKKPEDPRYEPRELLDCLPKLEAYLSSYVVLPDHSYVLPVALWILMTHVASVFDALPFLVINSTTKRSGKTHMADMLSFTCCNATAPLKSTTAAALYEMITLRKIAMRQSVESRGDNEQEYANREPLGMPTVLLDEAEFLSSGKGEMRPLLNVYEQSDTQVARFGKTYDVYCPKAFSLIGDVHDTLRDRCIVLTLRRKMRKETKREWIKRHVRTEGEALQRQISAVIDQDLYPIEDLEDIYESTRLKFLNDRDEDLWRPLFAVCQWLSPQRIPELERVAADLSAAKTAPARKHGELREFEKKLEEQEYGERLLLDMVGIMGERRQATTEELLAGLFEIRTGPWRTFRGRGINDQSIARLLRRFGIGPYTIRVKPKGKQATKKGYRRDDLLRAAQDLGDDRKRA